jgi:hypothetical protein
MQNALRGSVEIVRRFQRPPLFAWKTPGKSEQRKNTPVSFGIWEKLDAWTLARPPDGDTGADDVLTHLFLSKRVLENSVVIARARPLLWQPGGSPAHGSTRPASPWPVSESGPARRDFSISTCGAPCWVSGIIPPHRRETGSARSRSTDRVHMLHGK